MPGTTSRGYPFPLAGEAPAGHTNIADLAMALNTDVASVEAGAEGYADSRLPAGVVVPFAGAGSPAGWLLCDGATILRGQYPALFDAIGTTYGAGDGSTTFDLPDMASRVPVMPGSSLGAIGAVGGEISHALSEAELPVMAGDIVLHAATGGATSVWQVNGVFSSGAGPANAYSGPQSPIGGAPSVNIIHFQAGSGSPHNNMPPYMVMNYIIRT